jgi:Arc/MetJ-type ribon-helix-helix transcriptional regulator
METMNVPITDSLKNFVENQATKRGFSSPGDYVQSILLDLERRELAKKDLEEKLREGLRSPLIEADEAFWRELEREFLEKHPELSSCDE